MPSLTSITINDGADTPVAHTYVPQGRATNVPTFIESDGTPAGNNVLTVSSSHGKRHKVSTRLKLPITVTETVNGVSVEKIVRTTYLRFDVDFDEYSTEAERKDAVTLFHNLLAPSQTAVRSVMVDLHDFY